MMRDRWRLKVHTRTNVHVKSANMRDPHHSEYVLLFDLADSAEFILCVSDGHIDSPG
jgi:hypothetical protein